MKTTVLTSNKWARNMTAKEIENWIAAQIECKQAKLTGYWTAKLMVVCPFGKALAIVG